MGYSARVFTLGFGLLGGLAIGLPGVAHAKGKVLAPRLPADLTPGQRTEIRTHLEEGLRGTGLTLWSEGEAACADATCVSESGEAVALTVTIEREGADYRVSSTLWVLDARGGLVERAQDHDTCEICGTAELADTVAGMSARLSETLDELGEPAVLRVESEPSGAVVLVDGRRVGTTPVRVELEPGRHETSLEKAGYASKTRSVLLEAGVAERLVLMLDPQNVGRRGLRIAGGTLVGIGGLAMIASVPLFVMDQSPVRNRCDGANVDPGGNCRYRYNTTGAAAAVLVPGALATGIGAALLVAGRRTHTERQRVELGLGATGVSVGGVF